MFRFEVGGHYWRGVWRLSGNLRAGLWEMRENFAGTTFAHPARRRPFVNDLMRVMGGGPLSRIQKHGQGLGPIFEMKVFGFKMVIIASAELAAEVCDERRFTKDLSIALEELRYLVGDGLFTARNDEPNWELAHNILLPAFDKSSMCSYHSIMTATLSELFVRWDSRDTAVDVSHDMTALTLETISRAAFSRDFGSLTSDERHPFVEAMVAALLLSQRKSLYASIPGGQILKWRVNREFRRHREYLDTLVDDMISERRNGGTSHDDLLGLMLESADPLTGRSLDDLNIRHQILTFLVAGHETTSGALSFALHYLSQNPQIRAQAQAEADDILGPDTNTEPSFEQIPKFRYTRRVLDESLRLWPTAPAFARRPIQETTLGGRYRMMPDDWVLVMLPMTHRDPHAWGDDALVFDPDRFLPANSRGRMKGIYKPFGTGERACIGRQFAIHEAILALARIVHRYEFEADPDYVLQTSERLTIAPRNLTLQFTRRTPQVADAPGSADPGASMSDPSTGRCPVAH